MTELGDGPRSVPQILDAALRIYMGRFGLFFAISAGAGVLVWLMELTGPRILVPAAIRGSFSSLLPLGYSVTVPTLWGSLLASLAQFLAVAAIIVAADAAARPATGGVPLGLGVTLRAGLRRLWPFLVTGLVVAVTAGAGLLLLIVPGIFLGTRWSVAQVAAVVEGRRASSALGRSFALVRGLFWHAFGAICLGYLAAGLVGIVLHLPGLIPGSGRAALTLKSLWAVAAAAATLPYPYCVQVLLLQDLRARKEGADLAHDGAA